ncbi:uncharacterized protein LOC113377955 [Ctenocephalides felis]|uniref:uncharacterized protein LOC113377955 n=1 Tax=Ctenocephalides felis TaxID=7515 RepID=UPI000E6E17F5|nr:uncharacterized protein LOC113377955 [Ctenocephalides felis]
MSSQIMNKIRKNRLEKKKKTKGNTNIEITEKPKDDTVNRVDVGKEKTLDRLAEEELLREAISGAIRAEVAGPTGWLKCPLYKTNKRFLKNTLASTIRHNGFKDKKIENLRRKNHEDKNYLGKKKLDIIKELNNVGKSSNEALLHKRTVYE